VILKVALSLLNLAVENLKTSSKKFQDYIKLETKF
jgi:hypothetical protein